ncbi:MAG: response regulator transcription factor [Chloroflexi bacterium]|nr:response regulator transcription factor [Chloroflexota bacterium]
MTAPIRLLIVDDQRLMREGLRTLLELEGGFVIVAEAGEGQEALEAYNTHQPDVVLMDIRMPGMDGVEATRRLRSGWPDVRVLILTTFSDDALVFEGLRAGALGYVLKDISGHELAHAVRTVASGGAHLDPAVARKVVAEFGRLAPPARTPDAGLAETLSERELAVLQLLAEGLTNREIGLRLHLTEGTIKNYVTTVLQKLGTRDRTQAALRGRALGII